MLPSWPQHSSTRSSGWWVSSQDSAFHDQSPTKCLGTLLAHPAALGYRHIAPPQTQLAPKELPAWNPIPRLPCGHHAQHLLSSTRIPTSHPFPGYLPAPSTSSCHHSHPTQLPSTSWMIKPSWGCCLPPTPIPGTRLLGPVWAAQLPGLLERVCHGR